ncbi:MAG: hypothetical protein ACREQA_22980 [Candidatus Binatia bacterium]
MPAKKFSGLKLTQQPTLEIIVLLALFFGLTACATQRPVLYPNAYYKRIGSNVAEQDIDDCMRRAEEYVSSGGRGVDIAGSAATGAGTGAAIGAAGGAAGGAVVGHAGRGAAVGAAGGGAAGLTRGALRGASRSRQPNSVYRNFVNRCLREKGYDPIGWQ